MKRHWHAALALASLAALGLAGCTDAADLMPVNAQAQAIGSPHLQYFQGFAGGPMKVTMPDGEILPGTFHVAENFAPPTPTGPGDNFHATAQGPRTSLTCHGVLVAGHGTVDCLTQNGASYRVQL